MKVTSVLFYFFCSHFVDAQAQTVTASDFSKLEWLSGTWTRTNVKPGRSGQEVWTKSGNEWIGKGIAMRGTDTAFVEKLKIVVQANAIYYVADVPGNKQPVLFELTLLNGNGFVAENAAHDFPKKIVYLLEGKKLKATISGDGKAIDYLFERSE